jgi:hypothetical protein
MQFEECHIPGQNTFLNSHFYSVCSLMGQCAEYSRIVVTARQTENRFLGSLKGLQIRALYFYSFSIKNVQYVLRRRENDRCSKYRCAVLIDKSVGGQSADCLLHDSQSAMSAATGLWISALAVFSSLLCFNCFPPWFSSHLPLHILRGRILERNWDTSLKSFPPCYTVTSTNGFFPPPPRSKVA